MPILFNPVEPPQIQAPEVSLLRTARNPRTDARWQDGLSFQSINYGSEWTDDPCTQRVGSDTVSGGPGYIPPGPKAINYYPPVHRVADRNPPFGFEMHDYEGRVRQLADAALPMQVEYEFWTGAQAQASGWANSTTNLYLAHPRATVLTTTGTPSIRRAFEMLEQAMGSFGFGGKGIIHCVRGALPQLTMIKADGNLLKTASGNLVVPGVGYPGTGPGGSAPPAGQTWIYATGLVDAYVDETQIFPKPSDYDNDREFLGAAMDRSVNDIIVRGERLAAAVWDGQMHFAVLAALET